MKNITTLEIGGPAKKFIEVEREEKLVEAVKFARENFLPYLVIGSGSNLLVSDQGFEGLIIKNNIQGITIRARGYSDGVTKLAEPLLVTAKAGTILQDLVDFSIEKGLAGLNKMTGIPGTLGGAVYGNAGAYGQTISDNLVKVKAFDGEKIVSLNREGCQFGYRDSIFKKNEAKLPSKGSKYTILEMEFLLSDGNKDELRKQADETLRKRLIKYPKGIKCPGSFFKNLVASDLSKEILDKIPQEKIIYGKVPAGALLEEVGAKGKRLGNIEIATYHANLFINLGEGKAKDFYNLAKEYAKKVKEKYGITLEPEVQLINLPPIS